MDKKSAVVEIAPAIGNAFGFDAQYVKLCFAEAPIP
jgi:hypothetical protein